MSKLEGPIDELTAKLAALVTRDVTSTMTRTMKKARPETSIDEINAAVLRVCQLATALVEGIIEHNQRAAAAAAALHKEGNA